MTPLPGQLEAPQLLNRVTKAQHFPVSASLICFKFSGWGWPGVMSTVLYVVHCRGRFTSKSNSEFPVTVHVHAYNDP